jgi:CheY-like chemotaxis protein
MPDLILMDIGLPGISGLDATKIIKENNKSKQIPVIAVTAFAMKEDETRAIQAGCDSFIAKPVNIRDLIREIERWVSRSETYPKIELKGGISNG